MNATSPNETPTIIAHRGLHAEHPENSLEAFAAAWAAGVEWCECDVRASADNEPFVLHDETLDRTTTGAGRVDEATSSTLSQLKLRRHDGGETASVLPRLQALLNAMPSHAKLLMEIKPRVHEDVVRRTLEACDEAACVVQSFDPDILHLAQRIRPEIRRALLVDDAAMPSTMQPGSLEGINARHNTLLPEHVEQLREMGRSVGVWTPNDPADIRRAIGLKVDTIITDEPLRAADLLRALARVRRN